MSLFAPKIPEPRPAPPPPVRTDPEVTASIEEQRRLDARRKGRSATILTDSVSATPTVDRPAARSAQLLGEV